MVEMFSDSWNWENRWRERIPNRKKTCSELAGTHFMIGKIKFRWKFRSPKGPKSKKIAEFRGIPNGFPNQGSFFVGFLGQCWWRWLSSQSTYKVNIDDPYYKASIVPNPKVRNDLKLSKEQLEKVYQRIMEKLNDLRLQIES